MMGSASTGERLHALDAVRGFALLAGIALHSAVSFLPGFDTTGWPVVDSSSSAPLGVLYYVIHMFRMTLFFMIAGFFGHMQFHRRGARAFVRDRAVRILVPLVAGWIVFVPLASASLIWGAARAHAVRPPAVAQPPPGVLAFPLAHLWFLYALILLYGVTLAARAALIHTIDAEGGIRRWTDDWVRVVVHNRLAVLLLAAPVCLALYTMHEWRWFGIPTPERSLVPNPTATIAFGMAFAFGWLLQRQSDLLAVWERHWAFHTGVAVAMTAASLSIIGILPVFSAAAPGRATFIYSACYALGTWAWTFACVGIALKFFADASPVRRYVADASYWAYLAHLPLIFFLQGLVRNLPWHWSVKFPLIVATALLLLFASYHVLVRFTFIGRVLNGQRVLRAAGRRTPLEAAASEPVL